MKILNWNTEWLGPTSRNGRFEKGRDLVSHYDADVICLTEAKPETMPNGGHTISSERSGAGNIENRGARKVILWSRYGWHDIDSIGSERLPEGRFVRACTVVNDQEWTIVGMCIPYHGYRSNLEQWGQGRKRNWQGAGEYLDGLREDILPQARYQRRTVLLGDFNLQIPAKNYPYPRSEVNGKRETTFASWHLPTSGELNDPALDKRFIDHIAHTADIRANSMQFISRFDKDGARLSDHNGVCIEIESA